jgi:predicted HicB family RNase H-like nuclease
MGRSRKLFIAAGSRVIEGSGSGVRFEYREVVATFHRPHPQKEAKRYQMRKAREFLSKNTLTYKGYSARIDFDPDDMIFVGQLAGINDIVGFHGSSVEELATVFHEAVDDYLETCAKVGKAPEKPFRQGHVSRRSGGSRQGGACRAAFGQEPEPVGGGGAPGSRGTKLEQSQGCVIARCRRVFAEHSLKPLAPP